MYDVRGTMEDVLLMYDVRGTMEDVFLIYDVRGTMEDVLLMEMNYGDCLFLGILVGNYYS